MYYCLETLTLWVVPGLIFVIHQMVCFLQELTDEIGIQEESLCFCIAFCFMKSQILHYNYIIFLLNLQYLSLYSSFHSTCKHNQDILILEQLTETKHPFHLLLTPLPFPESLCLSPVLLLPYVFVHFLEHAMMPSMQWANRKHFISILLLEFQVV